MQFFKHSRYYYPDWWLTKVVFISLLWSVYLSVCLFVCFYSVGCLLTLMITPLPCKSVFDGIKSKTGGNGDNLSAMIFQIEEQEQNL